MPILQISSERKAVFVPINRDLAPSTNSNGKDGIHTESQPPSRRMSTQRDIYLPDRVPMSALNNGYIPDAHEPKQIPEKFETDSIEVLLTVQLPVEFYISCSVNVLIC